MSYERNTQKGWIDTDWVTSGIRTFVLPQTNVSRAAPMKRQRHHLSNIQVPCKKRDIFFTRKQLSFIQICEWKARRRRIETVRILVLSQRLFADRLHQFHEPDHGKK